MTDNRLSYTLHCMGVYAIPRTPVLPPTLTGKADMQQDRATEWHGAPHPSVLCPVKLPSQMAAGIKVSPATDLMAVRSRPLQCFTKQPRCLPS